MAWFVCAGTDGKVAYEDVLVAGAVMDQLGEAPAADAELIAHAAWQAVKYEAANQQMKPAVLEQVFAKASGGSNLIENGFTDDVHFAAQLDTLDIVPKSTQPWDTFRASST